MNELSGTELDRMRSHAEESMFDLCTILRYSSGAEDDFNVTADTWTPDTELTPCGFKITTNAEAMVEAEVVMIDAELRIPFDTAIDRRDKIRLEYRLGEFIDSADQEVFEIVGQPIHGHAAIVLKLIRDVE